MWVAGGPGQGIWLLCKLHACERLVYVLVAAPCISQARAAALWLRTFHVHVHVHCPDTAPAPPAQVRAKRRYDELLRRGITASYDAVLADMNERDRRDSSRATAPLKPAEDAFILDTSEMDAAHALAAAKAYVGEKLAAVSAAGGQE